MRWRISTKKADEEKDSRTPGVYLHIGTTFNLVMYESEHTGNELNGRLQ